MTSSSPKDQDRPEAGADTRNGKRGEGATTRDAQSGGTRTSAGGTYGDHVPNAGQPRRNDDRDADRSVPGGDPYTGGGNLDRLGEKPQSSDDAADEAEKIAEDNRNKDFDTTHTHSSTTSRKV